VAGWVDFERAGGERLTAAVLTEFLPNVRSSWNLLGRPGPLLRAARSGSRSSHGSGAARSPGTQTGISGADLARDHPGKSLLELARSEPPENAIKLIGTFLESARLLGQRTAELHAA